MTKIFTAGAGYIVRPWTLPEGDLRYRRTRCAAPPSPPSSSRSRSSSSRAPPRRAQHATALRLAPFASGFSSPIQVTAPRGSARRRLRRRAGRPRPRRQGGEGAGGSRSSTCARLTQAGGEQGLLGLAFAPDYATSRQFVIDYTDRNGDTQSRPLPLERTGRSRQRHAAAVRRPAVREPQRRQRRLRQGRASLRRHGRRRLGRRSREPGSESGLAARQDPAPRPGPSGIEAA